MKAEKPDFRGLIQAVTGIPETEQRELLAPFAPSEIYPCYSAEDFDNYLRQIRPPRVALVPYIGILAEQSGNVDDRKDHLAAMKAGIHRKGGYVVEAATKRRSDRAWKAMKRDGEEMCRRLAQGRRSALNGRKGAEPYEFKDEHMMRFALEMAKSYPAKKDKKDPTPDDRRIAKIAAYCKSKKINCPRRTWLKQKLPALMRERNLS